MSLTALRNGTGHVRHQDEARAARRTLEYYASHSGATRAQILLDAVYDALQHADIVTLADGLADVEAIASKWRHLLDAEQ